MAKVKTKTFSNSEMAKKASQSANWQYEGHYGDNSADAREKAISLVKSGKNAFYKKIIEKGSVNYHVYSF
jgi:hypothetical protein